MNYDYDPELPNCCQSADMEMAALEEEANRRSRLRAKGICDHGWVSPNGDGRVKCNHCGAVIDDPFPACS